MKLRLFLIGLAVIQFFGLGQAEAVLNDNNNRSVDRNAVKHKVRKCPMERYGMCPDIGDDVDNVVSPEAQKKLAERKTKCIAAIMDLGKMARTQKLIGSLLSTLFN